VKLHIEYLILHDSRAKIIFQNLID